jgi:hypothetical protein
MLQAVARVARGRKRQLLVQAAAPLQQLPLGRPLIRMIISRRWT